MNQETIELKVDGVALSLAVLRRTGTKSPLVCLHGFGASKEDYADLARHPTFADRTIVTYDAPGSMRSECTDFSALSIDFLRQSAAAIVAHYGLDTFHLLGHSMGGLTALMLADAMPERVLSLTSIEGNMAPEDCFLSRQIIDHPAADDQAFLGQFIQRAGASSGMSNALYASGLGGKVHAAAVAPIFRSMVDLSDNAPLMDIFLALPMAKMFVYGDENGSLSYLPTLARAGVRLGEISNSGHFPMYSNPVALWRVLSEFIGDVEREASDGR